MKAQLICLSAGRDGCRMTSAYHSTADHFLALEGRAACCCTRAAQPCAVPAAGPSTVTSWAGAEPRTRPASFTKGQTEAETLRRPGKGRSFPALPECHTSAAPPVWCLVQRSPPRRLPLRFQAPGVSSDCHTLQMGLSSSTPLPLASSSCVKECQKASFSSGLSYSQFFSCLCLVVLLLISLLQILNSHLSTSRRPSSSARKRTLGYHALCPSQTLTSH